jgi:hypothetical protein
MALRIQYRAVPDRIFPYYSVWVAKKDHPNYLVGFVSEVNGQWLARGRGCSDATRHATRTEAAAACLIVGEFAQRPAPAPMQVAA